MNLILQYQFFILLGIALIGLALLGWQIYKLRKKLRVIMGEDTGIETHLQSDILRRMTKTEMALEEAMPRLRALEKIAVSSIHKIGFLRFNPFRDTGGNQSFVLALLDHGDNGVIISSLYTREGIRLYAKSVAEGLPKQPLSEEEKKVLEETIAKQ